MLRSMSISRIPAFQPVLWPRRSITMLTAAFGSLHEGLAASRRYSRLRSIGASHDAALRDALDVGPAPSQPIHFAGRT